MRAALLLLALPVLFLPQEPEQPQPRILVTNDDGIGAEGLKALVAALDPLGEVIVCAPAQNCSGASQSSVCFGEELTVAAAEIPGAELARSVSGKPVDAAAFGILELGREKPFDLVVSGINQGSNVGLVAHYSGTIGAAMEAARRGIPAMAVSLESRGGDIPAAAAFSARFAAQLLEQGAAKGVVYSINIPAGEPGKVESARMGGCYLDLQGFQQTAGGTWRARTAMLADAPVESDTRAYFAGRITITPLRVDWTDSAERERLAGWSLAPR